MIRIEHDRDNYLVLRVSGELGKADYKAAVPELENELKLHAAPLRLMIVLEDFRGWDIAGLWQELKFDVKHANDFGRIAVLGESALEEWGTALSKPFFGSEVRYFDLRERATARAWLSEPRPAT
jgi:SpoIIAA-like